MKSCKAVVNGQGAKQSRLGILSLVSWMVVSLSVGTVYAENPEAPKVDGVQIFKLNADKTVGDQVKPIDANREKQAVELLGAVPPDLQGFVEKFQSEPTQLVEALRWALNSSKNFTDAGDALINSLQNDLAKIDSKFFGDAKRKTSIVKLIEDALKLHEEHKLENLTAEELLTKLFKDKELLASLNLTDKKAAAVVQKPPVQKPPVQKPPVMEDPKPAPVVGEQDDLIKQQAQYICDRYNALKKQSQDAISAAVKPLKDTINELYNRLAQAARKPAPEKVADQKAEKDPMADLLKAIGMEPKKDVAAPPEKSAAASSPAKDDEGGNKQRDSVLDKPLPQPNPPQQGGGGMPMMGGMPQNTQTATTSHPPINLDLPTSSATTGLKKAAEATSNAEELVLNKPLPQTINPNTGMPFHPRLVANKIRRAMGETEAQLSEVQSSEKLVKAQMAQIDNDLAKIRGDARNAEPRWAKLEQQRLQQVYDTAKSNNDQQKQSMQSQQAMAQQMMMSQDPQAAQQGQMIMMQVSQAVGASSKAMTDAQAALNQFNTERESAIEEGNGRIAGLKQDRTQLETALTDLGSTKGKLSSRMKQLNELQDDNVQEMQALAQRSQQAPNANLIAGAPAGRGMGRPMGNALSNRGIGRQNL